MNSLLFILTAPGVPKDYPEPKKLVTEDCIKPA